MDKKKALDRIRKCMRLSRSSNPHEASAALRQAQALMREYAVSEADLLASEASEARARSRAAKTPVNWEVALANMVAECFGCEVIFCEGARTGEFAFIGAGAHAEIAGYAFAVLLRQCAKARAEYVKKHLARCRPVSRTRRADEFCHFWLVAVQRKVSALVPGAAEVLAIAAFRDKHYNALVTFKGRDRGAGNLGDRLLGLQAGAGVELHRGVQPGAAAAQLASREPPA